jgi:hypothetical protein
MLILLIFLTYVATSQIVASNHTWSWKEFKQKYSLYYSIEEDKYRQQIYQQNITQLQQHPCEYCGVTKFFASTQK